MQTVTWTYVLILSHHCHCLTTLGYPELSLAAKDMVSVITFALLPVHLHTLHSLFLKIRSKKSLCQSLLPVLKWREASHAHLLLTLNKYINTYREWKNKRKEGGERGREEEKREERRVMGKGRGEEKNTFHHHFFFFFLIGRKIPAKNFTSLLTNSLREETHTI